MSISRSTVCSLLLLLSVFLAAPAVAQQRQQGQQHLSKDEQLRQRMKAIDDSIPFFRGVQIKADLVGPIQRAVSSYGQYEVGVRVNLKDKYFPLVELG